VSSDNVRLHKAFCFRLYPTRAQETALNATLDTLRHVYNSLLNDRKFLYETTGNGISQYSQEKYFAPWRKEFSELADVHSHLLQNAALRVNLAFTAFFRRVKSGETPGFPRMKGVGAYDSLGFKEWGNGVSFKHGNLFVSKIGEIKGKFHRPLEGTPKTATLRRRAGKWFVCIACEVSPEPLPLSEEAVGIDVGLKTFAALSNGEGDNFFIENPRFLRRDEKALAKAGRKQAKTKKRSQERREANKVLARIHERIRNRRHDFCHQNARRIVHRFGVIAVEKLNVKGMVQNHSLAKSISDAAWSQFRECLTSKAASADREIHAVDPAYTSQDCSACGYRAKKKLSERWHLCPMCGASLDRDTNAAINIINRCGTTQRGRYTVPEAVGL